MVGRLEGNLQGGQSFQKTPFKLIACDLTGEMQEKLPVITDAGGGSAVSTLPSQDEIHLLYIRAHRLRQLHQSEVGEGV